MKQTLKKFIGPFPVLPLYSGIAGYFITQYGIVHFAPVGATQLESYRNAFAPALITGLSIGIPVWILKQILDQARTTRSYLARYYIGVLFCSFIYTYFQDVAIPGDVNNARVLFGDIKYDYVRNIFPIFLAANFMGFLYVKLHNEIKEKESALDLVQTQNNIIIENVEQSRENIARFLHDRVQAALVTVSMQIAEIGKDLSQQDSARLNSVIAELEHIRGVEVRSAAMRLSPDLQVVGISSAIRNYADTFKPTVTTEILIDPSAEQWITPSSEKSQEHLGIYRIIEQAMLNAVVHGRPKNLTISFNVSKVAMSPTLTVEVSNDGQAIADGAIPGIGTAVTSGWLSILGARHRLTNTPAGLVVFHLELPFN